MDRSEIGLVLINELLSDILVSFRALHESGDSQSEVYYATKSLFDALQPKLVFKLIMRDFKEKYQVLFHLCAASNLVEYERVVILCRAHAFHG